MPIAEKLLAWYRSHARVLPWRSPPGTTAPDPYLVWLSEIMLQQTTVAAVKPYFARFTARWPTVAMLADADDAEVMAAWAGLGYYARARNLLACARIVAARGAFPDDEIGLRALPGIGAYTAAAIAAIAFGRRAVVVDGNVERVVARLFDVQTPLPTAKAELYRLTDTITPPADAGDFAQAMMDLGSTICTPRAPRCLLCPLAAECRTTAPEALPRKLPKPARPERNGVVWWIERDGHVLLVRRPANGLLGGMRALPGSEWTEGVATPGAQVTHGFTHFRLTLTVQRRDSAKGCNLPPDGEWWPVAKIGAAGLPTVFMKAATRAMTEERDVRRAA
jgi:A/G-specific adenine glycosylase